VEPLGLVLLLALPASGKSEIRRYLASLPPGVARSELGLGPTIQIDDYPYVHLMRRISHELRLDGEDPIFFADDTQPFLDDREWGTLTVLLDEDYRSLQAERDVSDPSRWLLKRIARARSSVGLPAVFTGRNRTLEVAIADDARRLVDGLPRGPIRRGQTVLVEFARGGPAGSPMPLEAPYGYRYSLSLLSREVLSRAVILYVWVTPEESRRKNLERARPGHDASTLFHGVPEAVMSAEYGVDDVEWMLATSDIPGTVAVEAHGSRYHLPTVRFDNRVDHTTFLRAERWQATDVEILHRRLVEAFDSLHVQSHETGDVVRLGDLPGEPFGSA
jgi:hypothetical protein